MPQLADHPSDQFVLEVMGARLRAVRRGRGLTLERVADAVGHGKSWLSRVEAGRLAITGPQIRRLCLVLQLDPAVVLLLSDRLGQ